MEPEPELKQLCGSEASFDSRQVSEPYADTGVRGRALEIEEEVELSVPFSISKLRSPKGEEETVFALYPDEGTFEIQRSRFSLLPHPHKMNEKGLSRKQCICTRIYPTMETSDGVYIGVLQGEVCFYSLNIWQVNSIWNELNRDHLSC